jgi:hypothetical protein
MMMKRFRPDLSRACSLMAGIAIALVALPAVVHAACSADGRALIRDLNGAWRGSGTVTPLGGQPERIVCRISYSVLRAGDGILQSIDCAGTDYRIQASSDVTCSGDRVSGLWQERIANNTGSVNGQIAGTRLTTEFKGPNFEGRLAVNFSSKTRHAVVISQFSPSAGRHVPVAEISLMR